MLSIVKMTPVCFIGRSLGSSYELKEEEPDVRFNKASEP